MELQLGIFMRFQLRLFFTNTYLHFSSSYDKINHSQPDNSQKGVFYEEKDVLLIGSVVILAALFWFVPRMIGMFHQEEKLQLRITVAGKEYGTYALEKEQTIEIQDTNVCEIKDGKVSMIFSPMSRLIVQKAGAYSQTGRNHCLSA